MLALLILAILVGGSLQRVAGMGFGLVAGPFIVLLIGPVEGVLFVNLAGAMMALLVLGRTIRGVDWHRYRWLVTASIAVTVPAALLIRDASASVLEVSMGGAVVGAMVLAQVTSRLRGSKRPFAPEARLPLLVTGAVAGFGSVAAGISGPPIAVYSVLDRWDPRGFAATVQPIFLTNALAAIAAKLLVADATFPDLAGWEWATVLVALVASVGLGELLAGRVSASATRKVLVALAYAGGFATLSRGLLGLIG